MILVTVTGSALLFLSGCYELSPCWFGLYTWFQFPGRAVASLQPDEVKHRDQESGKGLKAVESQSLFVSKQFLCPRDLSVRMMKIIYLKANRTLKEWRPMEHLSEFRHETMTRVMTNPGPHPKISGNVAPDISKGRILPCKTQQMHVLLEGLTTFCSLHSLSGVQHMVNFSVGSESVSGANAWDNYTSFSKLPDLASWSISILGDYKGLVFASLVLIIQEQQHILIGWQLKMQLNISESGRTFEDSPFLFCGFHCSSILVGFLFI